MPALACGRGQALLGFPRRARARVWARLTGAGRALARPRVGGRQVRARAGCARDDCRPAPPDSSPPSHPRPRDRRDAGHVGREHGGEERPDGTRAAGHDRRLLGRRAHPRPCVAREHTGCAGSDRSRDDRGREQRERERLSLLRVLLRRAVSRGGRDPDPPGARAAARARARRACSSGRCRGADADRA